MRNECTAADMDRELAGWKTGNAYGQVIGVYRRCFNILTDEGGIVSIFGSVPYLMPMSIRTRLDPDTVPFAECACEGDEVFIFQGTLSIPASGFRCRLGSAVLHEMRRRSVPGTDPQLLYRQCLRMAELMRVHARQAGEGANLTYWTEYLLHGKAIPPEKRILNAAARLKDAALSYDEERIRTCLMDTVGAGIGLTPSADDMISGMAHAIYMFRDDEAGDRFLQTLRGFIRENGRERTTRVSAQQLEQSACGIMSDPVYELLCCMAQDTPENMLEQALIRVLDYGGSSGTELCMGVLALCTLANTGA